MANIDPAPSWANIRRLETTDRNMAGPGGILNDPTTSIAARLNLLRDNDTSLGSSVAAVNARQDATDNAIANIEGQVLNAPGTLSDLENGTALDPAAAFTDVPSVENSLGPVDAINSSIGAVAARTNLIRNQITTLQDLQRQSYGRTTEAINLDDLGDLLQVLPVGRRVRLLADPDFWFLTTESDVSNQGGINVLVNKRLVDIRSIVWSPWQYGYRLGTSDTYAVQNTNAINECIAAMPSIDAYGASAGILWIPTGVGVTLGGHILDKRMTVMSPGPNSGILRFGAGATGSMFTTRAAYAGVCSVGFSGNPNNAPAANSFIELDAAYSWVDDIFDDNCPGTSIIVNRAIEWRVSRQRSRRARGYGLRTIAGAGCTDGCWSNSTVGQTGLSAFRLDTGSQNLSEIHTFGSGHLSTTDNHGGYFNSGKNTATNLQAETNMGYGLYFEGAGSRGNIVSGRSWGNCLSGIGINGAVDGQIVGMDLERNGVLNISGAATDNFAAINNVGGTGWKFDFKARDYASALPATSTDQQWGDYNYPGRTAVFTQNAAYASSSGADFNKLSGIGRKEDTRGGTSIRNSGSSGNNDNYVDFEQGDVAAPARTIVSGAVRITAEAPGRLVRITQASTDVTSILGLRSGQEGYLMWDLASGTPGNLVAGATLVLLNGAATVTPLNRQPIRFKAVSNGTSVVIYQVA